MQYGTSLHVWHQSLNHRHVSMAGICAACLVLCSLLFPVIADAAPATTCEPPVAAQQTQAPSVQDGLCSRHSERASSTPTPHVASPVIQEPPCITVGLSAVGDNLIHMPLVYEADAYAGYTGDGLYDFTPMYAGVADILATHDLNFIDQETILGGDDRGFSGYPSFNSPSVIAQQVADCGWNLITTATNHTYDQGLQGILNSCDTWSSVSNVAMAGTYTSWEDREHIRVLEVQGIRFALLAYTDYLNGYILPTDEEYAIAQADPDLMALEVYRAQQCADVVIVAMSWGAENALEPSPEQRAYAQHLSDLGVDLILGFGPHVIQPVEQLQQLDYTRDPAGIPTGHTTWVVYSLGNFLSNQPLAVENVGGCFSCIFEKVGSGPVRITETCWTPLINHAGGGWHMVIPLKEYTYELAATHWVLSGLADPLTFARNLTLDIIGPSGVYIDW